MRLRTWVAGVLLACCLVPAPAGAAELRGTVQDGKGRPVRNAKVVLQGAIVGQARVVFSQRNGEFRFWGLPPGRYVVTVSSRSATSKKDVTIGPEGSASTILVLP